MRAGCLLAAFGIPGAEWRDLQVERKRKRGRERKDTSCDINKDNIFTEPGLLLTDAGCRKKERGRRVGEGRGFNVCLLVYECLGNL